VGARILVLYAHPRPELSRVNQAMAEAVRDLDGVASRDLYGLYPDLHVDVAAEQKVLTEADVIVLHHPLQWYSGPPILKEWIDTVLVRGWAYGKGGTALRGKRMLSAVSTGGKREAYQRDGFHGYTVADFLRPYERTATLCGMQFLDPFVFYGSYAATEAQVHDHAQAYRQLLLTLGARSPEVR
jgi:glutathione-regulated potassium-efflux system ancillary protein KefG